jgi:hypothetical protein
VPVTYTRVVEDALSAHSRRGFFEMMSVIAEMGLAMIAMCGDGSTPALEDKRKAVRYHFGGTSRPDHNRSNLVDLASSREL